MKPFFFEKKDNERLVSLQETSFRYILNGSIRKHEEGERKREIH